MPTSFSPASVLVVLITCPDASVVFGFCAQRKTQAEVLDKKGRCR